MYEIVITPSFQSYSVNVFVYNHNITITMLHKLLSYVIILTVSVCFSLEACGKLLVGHLCYSLSQDSHALIPYMVVS